MSIIDCLVSNVTIATALALVAALVGRVTVRPQIRHTLWVLVLVKLVTPPVVHMQVPFTISESNISQATAKSNTNVLAEQLPATKGVAEHGTDGAHRSHTSHSTRVTSNEAQTSDSATLASSPTVSWSGVLWGVWLAGTFCWYALAARRLFQFSNVLRYARPASVELRMEVRRIGVKYCLSNIPRVVVADGKVPPLIWSFGRKTTMVLPGGFLSKLKREERAGMLAHELAHLKRRDHWIRWFELFVLGIYWWNPVAWWARSQVQQAEEECCDGWVLWALPDHATQYAQTLVDAVEFLAAGPVLKPDIATAFSQGDSLKRRVEMILGLAVSRRLPWKLKMVLVLFALVVTPLSVVAQGKSSDKNETARTNTSKRVQGDVRLIRGTVVGPEGKPIAGAMLWYEYAFNKHTLTGLGVDARSDPEGRFTLEIPPAPLGKEVVERVYSVVWAYSPEHCLGSARPTSTHATEDGEGIHIELVPATDTSLIVLDPNGRPAAGVLVEPINYRTDMGYDLVPDGAKPLVGGHTDANGRVQLPAMARDRLFRASLTTETYGVQVQKFKVHAGEPAERTINLRPVCRIEGHLIAEEPEWVRGIRLVFGSEKQWESSEKSRPPWPTEGRADVTTNKEGRFVAPIIAAGRLSMLDVLLDDELPTRPELPQFVELSAGETTVLELPMLRLVDIRGSIVAQDTGEPLAGVELHVYYGKFRQGTDVTSDAKGQFWARVLPGRVRFQPMNLSKTKYLQLGSLHWHDVPEGAGGFELPAIEVVPSIPLDGRLVDQDNSAVADARIIAYYDNWLCSTAKAGKDGRFQLPKMPVSVAPDEATYRVKLGIGETRYMRKGEVDIIQTSPFVLRVKR